MLYAKRSWCVILTLIERGNKNELNFKDAVQNLCNGISKFHSSKFCFVTNYATGFVCANRTEQAFFYSFRYMNPANFSE